MRISKIENKLGLKPMEEEKQEEIIIAEETEENAVVTYTDNPALQDDIEKYKNDRKNNIDVLQTARTSIMEIVNSVGESVKTGGDSQDIDSFAKLVNTLTNVVGKLDDIGNPFKVEHFLDPKSKKSIQTDGTISNTQNNIYLGSPADLIKIARDMEAKETEADGEV